MSFAPEPEHMDLAIAVVATVDELRHNPSALPSIIFAILFDVRFSRDEECALQFTMKAQGIVSPDQLSGTVICIKWCQNSQETLFVVGCHIALAEQQGKQRVKLLFEPAPTTETRRRHKVHRARRRSRPSEYTATQHLPRFVLPSGNPHHSTLDESMGPSSAN